MLIISKTAKYSGKFCRFIKRKETKTAWLTAEWAGSTLAFAVTAYSLIMLKSFVLALFMLAIYSYGTYALFSIMLSK
jgi:hypothetical protein